MSAPLTDQLINADMSQEIFGSPFSLEQVDNGFSVQLIYTGSPNGTLSLEGRNAAGAPYVPLPSNYYSLSISAAGNQIFEYQSANFREVRLHYVPAGGSGLLSAFWYARRSS